MKFKKEIKNIIEDLQPRASEFEYFVGIINDLKYCKDVGLAYNEYYYQYISDPENLHKRHVFRLFLDNFQNHHEIIKRWYLLAKEKYILDPKNLNKKHVFRLFLDKFKDNHEIIEQWYLHAYEKYINDPSEINREIMFDFMRKFDHISSPWTNKLYHIWKEKRKINKKIKLITLRTNGSTNIVPTKFNWSSDFNYLRDHIWNYQHKYFNNKLNKKYWINPSFQGKSNILNSFRCEGIQVELNILKKDFIDLNELIESCWIINPMSLNLLIQYPDILKYIQNNNICISVTESDSSTYNFSILDKYQIPWTNQMRSWKEGTAFYTCPYGKKHWMENTFYCTEDKKIVDLFNLYNDWWMEEDANPDNIWPIEKEFKQCECGTWYREMNFQPHAIKSIITENKYISFYNNPRSMHLYSSYDLSFIKKYEYFQVVQQKDLKTFHIHINKNPSEKELEKIKNLINNLYESVNTNIIITHNKFKVGFNNKRPLFWSLYEGKINLRKKMKMDKFL